ncbi:hypothetical protein [Ensifer sp. BR816]|uniref:hypothetical protein n=1 Tax=Rhizobium sp. (strain BR816) TaxID=1057002 RepID=UPI00036E335C|nr:hypothetical protein [Ensifer sp. BR816]
MEMVSIQLRIPLDLKRFIEAEARRNLSSQNSEIVRSVRERKDKVDSRNEKGEATA